MKIKFLTIIASLLILPLAITSCLDSNDTTYELGTDDTISAFALDNIYGVNYKFTIDQVRREIYNQDSVPFGADTIINKILITTLSYSGWIITGDTMFNQNDSVNFLETSKINPLEFTVYAQDGQTSNMYKIWVNRHQIDPDSLVWGDAPYAEGFSGGAIAANQETQTVTLGEDVLVYSTNEATTTFFSKLNQWQTATSTNLDVAPVLASITNFNNTLYAVLEDGTIRRSTDGINWEAVTNQTLPADIAPEFKAKTIITTFYDQADSELDKTLACIIEDENGTSFATATIGETGELVWVRGDKVPYTTFENATPFPTGRLSAAKAFATSTGGQQAMLIGTPSSSETASTPWFSSDGLSWGALEVIAKHALPKWNEPTILHYGETLYAFGGAYDADSENDYSAIYTSVNGFVWTEIERGFFFPNEEGVSVFGGRTNYSLAVDKENYIWMTWGNEDEIWRGRLNRLTFIKQ